MKRAPDEWIAHVRAWRESGETAPEYCERLGLKLGSLRYWASRIRRDVDAALTSPPVRMARVVRATEAPTAPSTPTPKSIASAGSIVIAAGEFRVEVGAGFDEATLSRVLGVLAGVGR